MQARTKELDEHWEGEWYCITCQDYTGQPENHIGHYLVGLPHVCHRHNVHWGNIYANETVFVDKNDNGLFLTRLQ